MTHSASHRSSQTTLLALGLLILGGILLLRPLGVLSWGSLELLFRFWPLVAIGFGLDLLGLKTGRNISFGMLSVLPLGALVLLGPALGFSGRVVEETFHARLESTRSAEVQLELGAAPSRVSILADQGELFYARVIDQGRVNFSVRGNEHKTVHLESRGRFFGLGNEGGRWDVALTPEIPLKLGVDAGSGQTELDLWGLELSALDIEGGSGTLDITLPASEALYEAALDSGSGRTTLDIEDGATLGLEVDGGSGALAMTFGENVAASVELDGGSGPMTFTLPDGSEARFEVEDSGSGSITVDPRLTQIEGDDDEGIWETAGFAEAERAVTIRLEDGGSGSVQVR